MMEMEPEVRPAEGRCVPVTGFQSSPSPWGEGWGEGLTLKKLLTLIRRWLLILKT